MASLKRILNDDDSQTLDQERYGSNSNVQRSTIHGSPSYYNYPHASFSFHQPRPVPSDTFMSGSTLQSDHSSLGTNMAFDGFSELGSTFELSHEPFSLEHSQTGPGQSFDDFLSHDMSISDPVWLDPPPVAESLLNLNISTSDNSVTLSAPITENDTNICYGAVSRTTVRLTGNMLQLEHKLQQTGTTYGLGFLSFECRPGPEGMTLHFSDGTRFGSTNMHFSEGAQSALLLSPVRMEAIANVANVRDRIGRANKASEAHVRVDVNVFGPKKDARIVGKVLSDAKLWLQKPDFLEKGVQYENPQFLDLEEFKQPEIEQPESEQQLVQMPSNSESLGKDNNTKFQETVENVLNSLTRHKQLSRAEKDSRVKTQLLEHQAEALDFMIQREEGDIPENFCLWKREVDNDVEQYRHAVTGATSRTKLSEAGGGVLADDMGMGKSLSILSLVAKSSDRADKWLHGGGDEQSQGLNSSKQRSKATLIIVSSALLINEWIHEMNKHLDGTITSLKYHGMKRKTLKDKLGTADIVLTTYNTVVKDFQNKSKRKGDSGLHEIDFFRVVLDEAHIIRRKGTLFNKAVSEFSARSRWCLTGTPIQNKFEDLGALFAFIRARPFNNIAMFRRFIANPFHEGGKRSAVAVARLITLIDALCIRRTKARLELPEAQEMRKELEFSTAEKLQYDKAVKDMDRNLRQQVENSKSMHDFGLFQINLQLRILCNHGTYQDPFAWIQKSWLDMREYALGALESTSEVICSYCKQTIPVTSARNMYRMHGELCRHVMCDLCRGPKSDEEAENDAGEIECSLCTKANLLRGVQGQSAAKKSIDAQYFRPNGYSTKMAQLVSDLREDLKKKSIVFSCWTRTLELVSRHLTHESIPFLRIDGGTSIRERETTLDIFEKRDDLAVLIMTTGTGAYGLNLTAANRIFIIEPQWNPAVENQAVSRAIRFGQTESVQVIRYVIKGTVEQGMRAQQNRKIMIAGVLDQNVEVGEEEGDGEGASEELDV